MRSNKLKIFFIIIAFFVFLIFLLFFLKPIKSSPSVPGVKMAPPSGQELIASPITNSNGPIDSVTTSTKEQLAELEIINPPSTAPEVKSLDLLGSKAVVPFTSQAPLSQWDDIYQQDGCEEASAIMAMAWVRGETKLDKIESRDLILEISNFQKEKYGAALDVHVEDVISWIFKDWFQYDKVRLLREVTLEQLKEELVMGNIILAPTNGQALKNPNFKSPGPERHMVVIKGYNASQKVFITNDPGTRNGENYHYDENLLYKAIRVYPTGYHQEIVGEEKTVIIVEK